MLRSTARKVQTTMASYDLPISMPGGFKSMADAKAHRSVVGKLQKSIELAKSTAGDLREADKVDVQSATSELYQDLAPGKGKVIMLSQPEGGPLMGAELDYNPTDGSTRRLEMDLGDSKLVQQGSTFKLQEGEVTTYFKMDEKRQVLTVMDADSEVPRIFGDADPNHLIGGTIQLPQPILIF